MRQRPFLDSWLCDKWYAYIYIHVSIYIYIYTCIHIYIYIYIHIHPYIYINIPVQESLSHHFKQFWSVLFSAIRPDSCGVCALFALVLLFHSLSGHLERNWGCVCMGYNREIQWWGSSFSGLASGKLSHNYGKSPFLMGKSTISMAIFNSYVKLPEGKLLNMTITMSVWYADTQMILFRWGYHWWLITGRHYLAQWCG